MARNGQPLFPLSVLVPLALKSQVAAPAEVAAPVVAPVDVKFEALEMVDPS